MRTNAATARTDDEELIVTHRVLHTSQDDELYDDKHRLIFNVGGYGSGKTLVTFLLLARQAREDPSQRVALFGNTIEQVYEGILPDLFEQMELAGIDHRFGSRPPDSWIRCWEKQGIRYPQRGPRSPHTWIWENGLHVVCGGIKGKAYTRKKGFQFRFAILEEVTEYDGPEVIDFLLPRVRCGNAASGECKQFHRHVVYGHMNPPPPDRPHWVRKYIAAMLKKEDERIEKGKKPFFRLIQSSTRENIEHVGSDYIERLEATFDSEMAKAMIDGDLTPVISTAAARKFSRAKHVVPVPYIQDRPVFLSLDFNIDPCTAMLCHPLTSDEVPEKWSDYDGEYLGVFGTVFHRGGMDVEELSILLCSGERATGFRLPDNFRGLRYHGNRVFAYGDATGNARRVESVGGNSAWKIVNSVMAENLGNRYVVEVPKANPAVFQSVSSLNAMLESAAGHVRCFIDPRNDELIDDLELTQWLEDGTGLDKSDGDRTHLLDELRYVISRRYPAHTRKTGTLKDLDAIAGHREGEASRVLAKLGLSPYTGR